MLISCIPSQPPQNTPKQPTFPQQGMQAPTSENQPKTPVNVEKNEQKISPQETSQNTSPLQSANTSKRTLNFGLPGRGVPYTVKVTQLNNDEGYAVEGSFGLSGTITRPEKDKDLWMFAGQFEFPSDKFKLGQIEYNIINAPSNYYTEKKPLPSDFPAQVVITIHLTIPPDARDEKGEVKAPFKIEIPSPKSSQFMIMMTTDV